MPADGFPFAVRVCREVNLGSVLGFLADTAQDIAASPDRDVFQIKVMIDIHTKLALGQIAYMPLGGFHLISFSQILADGFGLCRRLHDNQFLFVGCHFYLSPPGWINV